MWPEGEYAMESNKKYVLCSIGLGDDPNARADTDKLLAQFAGEDDLPQGLYDIAAQYERFGWYDEARKRYAEIAASFPGTRAADKAGLDIVKVDVLKLVDVADDGVVEEALDAMVHDYNDEPYMPLAASAVGREYYMRGFLGDREGLPRTRDAYMQAAIPILEKITSEVAEPSVKAHAVLLSGDCHLGLGEYENAAWCYERIVSEWGDWEYGGTAQYRIGYSYERMKKAGQMAAAEADARIRVAFERVVAEYPECAAVKAAWDWLSYNAIQEGEEL
jgi:hypothetical protein